MWLSMCNRQFTHFLLLLQQTWQTCCDLKIFGCPLRMLPFVWICFEMLSTQITLQSHSMWFIRVEKTVYPFLVNTIDNFNLDTEKLIYIKCFLMFILVLKCFPHRIHCNPSLCDIQCGKDSVCISCCYNNKLTNVLQPKNLWVPFSNAFTNSLTHEILKFFF